LIANAANLATILGSIPASSDTVDFEGWQMKQWFTVLKHIYTVHTVWRYAITLKNFTPKIVLVEMHYFA
jgi:hypothetical protein